MQKNTCGKMPCLGSAFQGLALIGLGAFLLTNGFALDFITIGSILAGSILLILCCLGRSRITGFLCFMLALITLYLVISGILAIQLSGALIVGLIMIGSGIITLLINVSFLINKSCRN